MNKNIINLVSKMDLNKSADEKEIMEVENRIGVKLPIQYKEFMLYSMVQKVNWEKIHIWLYGQLKKLFH